MRSDGGIGGDDKPDVGRSGFNPGSTAGKVGFAIGSALGGPALGLVGMGIGGFMAGAKGDPSGANAASAGGQGGRIPAGSILNQPGALREMIGSGLNPSTISYRDAFERNMPNAPLNTPVTNTFGLMGDTTFGDVVNPTVDLGPDHIDGGGGETYGSFMVGSTSTPASQRADQFGGFSSGGSPTSPYLSESVASKYEATRKVDEAESTLNKILQDRDEKKGDDYGIV